MVQQTYLDNVNMLDFLIAEYSLFPEITGSCRIKLQLLLFWSRCKLLLSPLFPPLPVFEWAGVPVKIRDVLWYSHVFSVENKTSTCFRGNNMETLLKCVLSLNKITSSRGLTLFFEIWGFSQGPLASLVSAESRKLLPELKELLCGEGLSLEYLHFLQQRPYMTVQGWRWNQLQNAKRKAWIPLWRSDWIGFGLSVWGKDGWCACTLRRLTQIPQTTRLVPSCDHVHLPLPAIPFFF